MRLGMIGCSVEEQRGRRQAPLPRGLPARQRAGFRRGSILIVTLWLVAVLTVLALAISRHLSIELRLVRRQLDLAKAQALAEGGIRYGVVLLKREQELEQGGPVADWLTDDWAQDKPLEGLSPESGGAGTGSVMVKIQDEERRLSLNTAQPQHLVALGLPAPVAQAIVDYWDGPDPAEEDPSATPPYRPKNAPFHSLQELWLIPAVRQAMESQPALWLTLSSETTPHLIQDSRNVNTASDAVLQAIGMPAELRANLLAYRSGASQDEPRYFYEAQGQLQSTTPFVGIDELRQFKAAYPALGTASQTFTVTATAALAREGRSYAIDAVVSRAPDCAAGQQNPRGVDACILSWKEL